MVRGPKKHMKRLNAPKHWMLDKLGGVFVRSCNTRSFVEAPLRVCVFVFVSERETGVSGAAGRRRQSEQERWQGGGATGDRQR